MSSLRSRRRVAVAAAACATLLLACATPPAPPRARVPAPHVFDDTPTPAPSSPAPPLPAQEPPAPAFDPAHTMTAHVLNVGQGAATLLEFPCGAVLIDTGGESNEAFDARPALIEQLDAFFARRSDLRRTIDLLVITHPHIDHMRGIPEVLARYTVRHVVDDGLDGDDVVKTEQDALRSYVKKHKVPYRAVKRDDVGMQGLTDGTIDPIACKAVNPVVRVLSGAVTGDPNWGFHYGHDNRDNPNNHSVVVRVDFGQASLLLTGDLETVAIDDLVRKFASTSMLDVDLYFAGHHGSHNGTTDALMEAMTPKVSVISMGPSSRQLPWTAWAFGHPRQLTVDRLERSSQNRKRAVVDVATAMKTFHSEDMTSAVYATGWDGPLAIDLHDDGTVAVRPPQR